MPVVSPTAMVPVMSSSASVRGPASSKSSTRSGPQALKRRVRPSAEAVFAVEPTKEHPPTVAEEDLPAVAGDQQ